MSQRRRRHDLQIRTAESEGIQENHSGGILTAGKILFAVGGFLAALFVVSWLASEGVSPGDIFEWMVEPFRWFFEWLGIETEWT